MGYNIGLRLIDEFLAKSGVNACQDFRDTCDVIAKAHRETSIGLSCCCFCWDYRNLRWFVVCFFLLAGKCMCVRSSLWYLWLCYSWCSLLFIGCPFPTLKNGDRHPSLPEKEKRTGPPGGFTNVPRRQWRGGHVEQGANTGCRWKSKTPSWTDGFGNQKKDIMHLLLVQNPWWLFEFLILMYSCLYVSMI